MFDRVQLRESFIGLSHLVAQLDSPGFGQNAAQLLANSCDAARGLLLTVGPTGQSLVLIGDATLGDSHSAPQTLSLPIVMNGKRPCPLSHAVVTGLSLSITGLSHGYDMASLMTLLNGPEINKGLSILPLERPGGGVLAISVVSEPLAAEQGRIGTEIQLMLRNVALLLQHRAKLRQAQEAQQSLSRSLSLAHSERGKLRAGAEAGRRRILPGRSVAMETLRGRIRATAFNKKPVLIVTSNSDSAEPIARQLLNDMGGDPGQLRVVPASALNGERFDIELFGHKRGAIPGISASRRGALSEVPKGLVLISNIEQLDMDCQARLHRLLAEGSYRPLGSSREHPLTARIAVSAPRDVAGRPEDSAILPALFFELRANTLVLPALHETVEDVPDILKSALQREDWSAAEIEKAAQDKTLLAALGHHVAESGRDGLAALIRLAAIMAREEQTCLASSHIRRASQPVGSVHHSALPNIGDQGLTEALANFEAGLIKQALIDCDGNRQAAAAKLSIPKRTLADKCKRYKL